jgi:hypothetical protein
MFVGPMESCLLIVSALEENTKILWILMNAGLVLQGGTLKIEFD